MRCQDCLRDINVGDWPFCPHGPAKPFAIETDESFIGGVTIENMGHEPVTVYSREEFKREMEARGLTQRIKHVPGDKYLINWAAAIDAKTLENARILLERGASTQESESLWTREPEFTVRQLSEAEAPAYTAKVR